MYLRDMSVILEFTVEHEAFQLGRVLAPPPEMHMELERVVPTGSMVMPFIWVTGEDVETFEADVQANQAVDQIQRLETIGTHLLYRITWKETPTELIKTIADVDAVLLEAQGKDTWVFRLRFPEHRELSRFHESIIEQQVPIEIQRSYTMTEPTDHGHLFNLTVAQREAIVLALEQGYFATPREVSLQELADELSISRQAVSKRVRQANETILTKVLLASPTEAD